MSLFRRIPGLRIDRQRLLLDLYSALLCLPALMIVPPCAWYVAKKIPAKIEDEPRRITLEYREKAEELFDHPERGELAAERPKEWQSKTRRTLNRLPWGYEVGEKETVVWLRRGKAEWRYARVATVEPFPYAAIFYGLGGAVGFVILGLTALAVWYFRRLMRERDDFLAATAHDLTTPVVGLKAMLSLGDIDESKTLAERMSVIVENIKEFMRGGARRAAPRTTTFDLVARTHEAYRIFSADYDDLGQPVAFEVAGDCGESGLPVRADETWTMQILWNLFGNDLKYAAPYGKVKVFLRRDAKLAYVDFADEGKGMTWYQRRHAFDRYYRARTVLASGKGGFGIGLCTARDSARAMHGSLTVRANRPKGCVFTLALPLA